MPRHTASLSYLFDNILRTLVFEVLHPSQQYYNLVETVSLQSDSGGMTDSSLTPVYAPDSLSISKSPHRQGQLKTMDPSTPTARVSFIS